MRPQVTKGIVLGRINYGEADRILTVLTPDQGKLSMMAKGVRKAKSRLAGGIELFSVSQITFIRGRGEVNTLISSRLETHFGNIVKDLDKVQLGYYFLKLIDKNTEERAEAGYFELLFSALGVLDSQSMALGLVRLHFEASLLNLAGHKPNFKRDSSGQPLSSEHNYGFEVGSACFKPSPKGQYSPVIIKFLRLVFSGSSAKALARIDGVESLLDASQPLVTAMMRSYLRI